MKNKKILLAIIALVAVAGLMVGIYFGAQALTSKGSKTITVTVVHKDGSQKEFTCHTDEEFLGPVLVAEKIVENNQEGYGLYIKVADGERADYTLDKAYWAVFIGDQEAMTGADEIPVHDGDTFKLVYTGA